MQTSQVSLSLHRVAGHIGAEIRDIDLAADLDDSIIDAVRRALLEHKVLFFRDQHLDHDRHIAFARRFGELTGRSRPQNGTESNVPPEILTIDPEIDLQLHGRDYESHYRGRWRTHKTGWHTDVSHAIDPPAGSILRAESVPAYGGDTQWTNLVAAYNGLPKKLQEFADTLQAEHSFFAGYRLRDSDPIDMEIEAMLSNPPRIAIHPVVRVHPETGEKVLFVNPSRTGRIVGFSPVESRHLLSLFFDQITRAEYTVRFSWKPGSVAFWDNRSTAHFAATDFAHTGERRCLHRVTLQGDRPVGPDGFISELVSGMPMAAVASA